MRTGQDLPLLKPLFDRSHHHSPCSAAPDAMRFRIGEFCVGIGDAILDTSAGGALKSVHICRRRVNEASRDVVKTLHQQARSWQAASIQRFA